MVCVSRFSPYIWAPYSTLFILAQKIKDAPTGEKSRMDKSLRPPEVILGMPFSSKVDIWMLGCTVGFFSHYFLRYHSPLFATDISFVDRKAARTQGKGDGRCD